jgi:hypothetical protein
MKGFLYEENVKFPARKPAAHIAATSNWADSRFRLLFCADVFQRAAAGSGWVGVSAGAWHSPTCSVWLRNPGGRFTYST